jgi:hypothetical protein
MAVGNIVSPMYFQPIKYLIILKSRLPVLAVAFGSVSISLFSPLRNSAPQPKQAHLLTVKTLF